MEQRKILDGGLGLLRELAVGLGLIRERMERRKILDGENVFESDPRSQLDSNRSWIDPRSRRGRGHRVEGGSGTAKMYFESSFRDLYGESAEFSVKNRL